MFASPLLSAPAATFRCETAAIGAMRASSDIIAQWRKQPLTVTGQALPSSFLKHCCDQTVVALRTVLAAIEQQGWQQQSFREWGVVAAPTFMGRASIAQSIERYRQEGPWGVSPHLLPYQSLHAVSGTISQALKSFGPNFGVGGGPNPAADAFLLAAAMLMDTSLPGLWLILSGHDTECIPARGQARNSPACHALALALTPENQANTGAHLSIKAGETAVAEEWDVSNFIGAWSGSGAVPRGEWRLSETLRIEWEAP